MSNRAELIELMQLILNFNPQQTDQNYTSDELVTALDQVYNEEVNSMIEFGLMEHMLRNVTITWPASSITLAVPASIKGKLLVTFRDVTGNEDSVGENLLMSSNGTTTVFWKDKDTMQWGTTGPSSTRTLRVSYLATADKLLTETSEPILIPPQYRYLLAWAGAVWLKVLLHESVPQLWLVKVKETRDRLWKFLSRGKPISSTPSIQLFQPMDGSMGSF